MSEENQVPNEAVVDSGTENVVQEVAQNEHIAESKKYRKRAQDAESQLANLQKQLQDQENIKLKENEEYKTLAEKYEAQVNELNPYKEKYQGLIDQRRNVLLEKLPEDKRETFKNKDIDVLELITSELSSKPLNEPQARGTVKSKTKSYTSLTNDEKKQNWADIVKSFAKK